MSFRGLRALCLQVIKANLSASYVGVLCDFFLRVSSSTGQTNKQIKKPYQTVNLVHIPQSVDKKTGTLGPNRVQLPSNRLHPMLELRKAKFRLSKCAESWGFLSSARARDGARRGLSPLGFLAQDSSDLIPVFKSIKHRDHRVVQ